MTTTTGQPETTPAAAALLSALASPRRHGLRLNIISPNGVTLARDCAVSVAANHTDGLMEVNLIHDTTSMGAFRDDALDAYRVALSRTSRKGLDDALVSALDAVRNGNPMGADMLTAVRHELQRRLSLAGGQ